MLNNTKLKEFVDIMSDIDAAIVRDPIVRQKYIHYLDDEIKKLEKELAVEKKPQLKYLEFDKTGKLIKVIVDGKARDFRKR